MFKKSKFSSIEEIIIFVMVLAAIGAVCSGYIIYHFVTKFW